MNKIKQLNNYNILSGGHIADVMDKAAQEHLIKHEPFYPYWLTASAKIKFLRQTDSLIPIRTDIKYRTGLFRSNRATVRVILVNRLKNEPIAVAKFKFVGKNKLAVKPCIRGKL